MLVFYPSFLRKGGVFLHPWGCAACPRCHSHPCGWIYGPATGDDFSGGGLRFLFFPPRFDGRCLFTVEDTFWRWFQALVAATDPRFGVVRGGRRWIFSVSGDRRRRPEVQGDLCCNFQLFQGVSCKPPGMYCALLIKFRFSQKKKWGRGLCWLRREVGCMSFFLLFFQCTYVIYT